MRDDFHVWLQELQVKYLVPAMYANSMPTEPVLI